MTDATDHKSFITSFAKHLNPGKIPFLEFANETMMEYMSHEPDEFYPLADMHKNWHDTIAENERVAIICARGHLKTSFSLTYLLWQMYSNPNFRALYIGNTFTQVVDKLTQFEELCRRSWRVAPNLIALAIEVVDLRSVTFRTSFRTFSFLSSHLPSLAHACTVDFDSL